MIKVELVGGPKDGEIMVIPSPAPTLIRFTLGPDVSSVGDGPVLATVGTYARRSGISDRMADFPGMLVKYDWKGWATR